MAGVKGRSGRHPLRMENWYLKVCDLTFRQAYNLIRDESVPLIDRIRTCLPLAMKYIPEKTIALSYTVNASESDMRAMLQLAQSNIESRAIHLVEVAEPSLPIEAKPLPTPIDTHQIKANVL